MKLRAPPPLPICRRSESSITAEDFEPAKQEPLQSVDLDNEFDM